MKVGVWFKQVRPQFLVLSVVLVLLGAAIAYSQGYFDFVKFILTLTGLVLVHISVNVINDYCDFNSGIDLNTVRTPFSGGSGILPQRLLQPELVYLFGLFCLGTAFLIGMYLVFVTSWKLLPLIFFGGLTSFFYTTKLTKLPIAELFAGLGLGSLPVIGTYFVQTGFYSSEVIVASLAPGFLTANLLLLNEFPDYEADRHGGRGHMVITLGRKKSAFVYASFTILTYFCIFIGVVIKMLPFTTIIAFITLPAAGRAMFVTFKNFNDSPAMVSALKANVIMVLGTDFLLAAGFFVSVFLFRA